MQPLEKSLRNKLEKTIKDARDIAEDAARAALEQLGVGEPTAYPHLTEADRKLRRKLRAHSRQLGNGRDAKGRQELDRLIEEVAYEHWHRMLFARFLAENNLLMYPDPDDPVAVTLEECEDLAADEGAANGWELASRFAARMLPQIFRPDSPVFQFVLPPEHQQKLEGLVIELPQQVFTAPDSLGWVYQFWQAKKKDEVNASEVKIGARELPAVTQLFTEPYMVSFLLDNSLGAWWAARRLSEADLKGASSEDELRSKAAIPGMPMQYLRFVKQDDGTWIPASGTFDKWPEQLSELKTMDPCCGSGHFLVAAFLMLVPMRMELEGLSAREAVDRVLSENIHGLELDHRCVELAAFALALASWTYHDAGGYRPLPELNLACSGMTINAKKQEWLSISVGNKELENGLTELYALFQNAPILGSLLNPGVIKGDLFTAAYAKTADLLTKALDRESEYTTEVAEMRVVAQGVTKAAKLLAGHYHWIITNVPYLLRRKQSETLKEFSEKHYSEAKHDLSTVFLERCFELSNNGNAGIVQIVMPQTWLYLVQYKAFRRKLLQTQQCKFIARLGAGAFQCISGEVVNIALLTFGHIPPDENHLVFGIDVSKKPDTASKARGLYLEPIKSISQQQLYRNTDSVIAFEVLDSSKLLAAHVRSFHGLSTTDTPRFSICFWEITENRRVWIFQIGTMKKTADFGGRSFRLRWEQGKGVLHELRGKAPIVITGLDAWGEKAVAISQMGKLAATLYDGDAFLDGTAVLLPRNKMELPAIYTFCCSDEYRKSIRRIDKSIKITYSTLAKVPFDLPRWEQIAKERYPKGLPKPYSDDPAQWIFHGYPSKSDDPLQVAVARLLGYRWPSETDPDMAFSDESRAWVKKSQVLLPLADEDGIVCIPPVRSEMKAEDRLENLLAAAYGSEWSSNKKAELLAQVGHAGKTLETWLRDKFFIQHCKLFHHRPFIWHIWDGLHDGFAALVNYHRLDAKLLETLIYNYLGDWISRQKQDIGSGVDGAQEKLAAAEVLKKKLELILEGEAPYDIVVRWKPIEKQPIGWDPDPNDGVRLNIRPFMTVGDVKKRGAGVLRDKPNIKWTKDRGKDVPSAPWYHLGPRYGGNEGDRINDHHLTLEEKRKAREQLK